MHIGIVGLGYVGAPLAAAFSDADFPVTGYDVDEARIDSLRANRTLVAEPAGGATGTETAGAATGTATPAYTTDPGSLTACDVIITAVPTPLGEDSSPDLSRVRAAGRTIGEWLTAGTTVVLESTVYPGATRGEFVPAIEDASGFRLGVEFEVGYSPERIDPGSDRRLETTTKPISATSAAARSMLAALYGEVVGDVHPAPSIEAAEAAKCLENAQRDVDIAFVNQFVMACAGIDWLDHEEVLAVADSKWNFRRYEPGLVEGHCIPIDPYFLAHAIEREGGETSLIREARAVNESVADYVGSLTVEAFERRRERVGGGGESLLAVGLAYKPNTDDVRSNAKRRLFDGLREADLEPIGYDPHVEPDAATEEFGIEIRSSLDVSDAAGVLVLTAHDQFADLSIEDLVGDLPESPVVVDTTGRLEEPAGSAVIYRRL